MFRLERNKANKNRSGVKSRVDVNLIASAFAGCVRYLGDSGTCPLPRETRGAITPIAPFCALIRVASRRRRRVYSL